MSLNDFEIVKRLGKVQIPPSYYFAMYMPALKYVSKEYR